MPFLFGLFGLCALAFAATIQIPDYQDAQFISLSLLVASSLLLLRQIFRRLVPQAKAPTLRPDVIIDGSNVMYWLDQTPKTQPLFDLLVELRQRGLTAGVVFDANAGHKLWQRYRDDFYFSQHLGLSEDQVLVVAKGSPADPVILMAARNHGAKIITNDRYRDWAEQFPEIATTGHLVRGGYHDGKLWLDKAALSQPKAQGVAAS